MLKDAGALGSEFGQLVVAGSTIADFGAVILLSLLFSQESSGIGNKLILLGMFVTVIAAAGLAVAGAGRSMRLTSALDRLQDTTAKLRVRGAMVLLLGFVAMAEMFGLETTLGAFMAGAVLSLVDRDRTMTHPNFRSKLEAMGFGLFVPVFFVASGLSFDLGRAVLEPVDRVADPAVPRGAADGAGGAGGARPRPGARPPQLALPPVATGRAAVRTGRPRPWTAWSGRCTAGVLPSRW